jgi:predicted kinase
LFQNVESEELTLPGTLRQTDAMDLVVVTGWTGAGKSTIANAIAASLDATAVSFDWVMSGLRVFPELWADIELPVERQRSVGWSIMSRVIEQQLSRGASAVADSSHETKLSNSGES